MAENDKAIPPPKEVFDLFSANNKDDVNDSGSSRKKLRKYLESATIGVNGTSSEQDERPTNESKTGTTTTSTIQDCSKVSSVPSFSVGDHVMCNQWQYFSLVQRHAIVMHVDEDSTIVASFDFRVDDSTTKRSGSTTITKEPPTRSSSSLWSVFRSGDENKEFRRRRKEKKTNDLYRLISREEMGRWRKVAYGADLLRSYLTGAAAARAVEDHPRLVSARAGFLLANADRALSYGAGDDYERASVWCKTGEWTDLRTANAAPVAAAACSIVAMQIMTGASAAAETLSCASVSLSPLIATTITTTPCAAFVAATVIGGGLVAGSIPLLSSAVSRKDRKRTENLLNTAFWESFWKCATKEIFAHVCSFLF